MSEPDVERAVVKTYVPAYQKDAWVDHADRLDMSQSEFVRTMVQAGRSGFEFEGMSQSTASNPADTTSADVTPGGNGLEDRVVELLESESHSSALL